MFKIFLDLLNLLFQLLYSIEHSYDSEDLRTMRCLWESWDLHLSVEVCKNLLWIIQNYFCSSESALDVLFIQSCCMNWRINNQELILVNMIDVKFYSLLNLLSVCLLQKRETTHIQWLKKMWQMSWHIKRNNKILNTEQIKLRIIVTVMSV